MPTTFSHVKDHVLTALYDYMLSSDEESFWFKVVDIREALPPEVSGAFVRRAIDALIAAKDVELGEGDDGSQVFALTEKGIQTAERVIVDRGSDLATYHPEPAMDRVLSRQSEPEIVGQVAAGVSAIASALRTSNEAAIALGDDKAIIQGELDAAENLVSNDRFRISRLNAFLLPALRFLADKFVGQGIGEIAKQLVTLLMKLY